MIPEPSCELWTWLQKFSDAYIWPRTDEDAAQRMGDNWHKVELAMQETITAAAGQNNLLPGLWKDASGILYHSNLATNLGPQGYGSAVDSFREVAQMCWDLARTVGQIKNQIYAELIMNVAFFAATFALPPGIGDFFRWRLVASLAERFSSIIRGAAGLLGHGGELAGAQALRRLGGQLATELVDESITDVVGQQLDIHRGFRPEGMDWRQVMISGGAGVIGEPLGRGLSRVGRIGSTPAGRLADVLRVGDRGKQLMQQSAHAFVVNSISSPVSSTAAQSIADGNFLETLMNPGKYAHAILTGGFNAGVLGAGRIAAVQTGDMTGQATSDWARMRLGMDPYVPPAGPHGPTPAINTTGSSGTETSGSGPLGSNPVSSGVPGSGVGDSGTAGSGTAGSGTAGSGMPGSGGSSGASGASGASGHGATGSGAGSSGSASDSSPAGAGRSAGAPAAADSDHHTPAQRTSHAGNTTDENRESRQPGPQAAHEEAQEHQPATTQQSTDRTTTDAPTSSAAQPTSAEPNTPQPTAANSPTTGPTPTQPTTAQPPPTHSTNSTTATPQQPTLTTTSSPPANTNPTGANTTAPLNANATAPNPANPNGATPLPANVPGPKSPGTGPTGANGSPTNATNTNAANTNRADANAAGANAADTNSSSANGTGAKAEDVDGVDVNSADASGAGQGQAAQAVDGESSERDVVPAAQQAGSQDPTDDGPLRHQQDGSDDQTAEHAPAERALAERGPADSAVDAGAGRAVDAAGVPKSGPAAVVPGSGQAFAMLPTVDFVPDVESISLDTSGPRKPGVVLTRSVGPSAEGSPDDVVPVSPADGQSVESAALEAFVRALNERTADGRLTPAAVAMRKRYYQTPDVSKATGEPSGRVKRWSAMDTFSVATPDGTVVDMQVPGLAYLQGGDFAPVEVVPSRPIKRTDARFDDPALRLTGDERITLQWATDRWMKSMGKWTHADVLPTEAERAAQGELSDEEFRELLDEATDATGLRPQETGEALGETYARVMIRWLENQYPGEEILRVPVRSMGGSGRFDQIYVRMGGGRILGFAAVEAKSVHGALGSRRGRDGRAYEQGHREYVRSILDAMMQRPGQLNEPGIAARMEAALDAGNFQYFVVKAQVEMLPNRAQAKGIAVTEYDLSPAVGAADPAGTAQHADHDHTHPNGDRINQEAAENGAGLERTAATVEEVAAAAGVDLSGIEVVLLDDPAEYAYLDDLGAMASAQQLDDGTIQVRLGPASFADRETLAATLAHEKTHADQFRAGRVATDNVPELEREARASEAPAVERLRAHDQVHDRSDVRPAEPARHRDPRQDPGRGGPGRHGPPDRGHEPGRADPRRGTELFRRDDPDGADDGPRTRPDAATGDGSRQPALTSEGAQPPRRNEVLTGDNGELVLRIRNLPPPPATKPSAPEAGPSARGAGRSAGGARRLVAEAMLAGRGALRGAGAGVFSAEARVPRQDLGRLAEAVEAAVRRGLEVELTFAMNPDSKWLEATAQVTDPSTGESVTYRRTGLGELADRIRPTVARTADPAPPPKPAAPTPPDRSAAPARPDRSAAPARPDRSAAPAPPGSPADPAPARAGRGERPVGRDGVVDGGPVEAASGRRVLDDPQQFAPVRSEDPSQEQARGDRFLPGWLLVGVEAARAILLPAVHQAANIREVVELGANRYQVTAAVGRVYVLHVRVGPLGPRTVAEYVAVPQTDNSTPVAEVMLSDRMVLGEVPQVLARVLAETAAAALAPSPAQLAGIEETPVLRPESDPALDPLLKAEDHGALAEARALAAEHETTTSAGRRRKIRQLMASLVASMSLGQQQPNSELLHTLLSRDDQAMAERFADRRSVKDDRPAARAYVVKSLRSSVLSAVLIGSAGYLATGSIVTGIALSVPTIVNSLVGAVTERWLDARKETGRQPAYDADRAVRDRDYPGMRGLLDGAPASAPDQQGKLPRATKQVHYVVRHAVPLLAATGTAAALTVAGIPAMSAVIVIGMSAAAKSLAERLVDMKKFDFRLGRVDSTVRKQLADSGNLQNQLVALLQDYRSQLGNLRAQLAGPTAAPVQTTGDPATRPSPGTPGFGVHAGAQAIDNVTAAARRLLSHVASTQNQDPAHPVADNDPTEFARKLDLFAEGLVNVIGPAVTGLLLGAVGDKIFVNLEEAAGDAQKNWDHAQREAVRGQALLDVLTDHLQQVDVALRQLQALVADHRPGVDFTDRVADRAKFPVAPAQPDGARPRGQSKYWVYLQQVAFAAVGAAGGVLLLDQIFDLDHVSVVVTLAGAVGGVTGTPVARMLFRRAELRRKELNTADLAKQSVDRRDLGRQAAIGKYLVAQLLDQIQQVRELLVAPARAVDVRPGDPEYTDRVRAAAELAYLDNVAPTQDRDVRTQRVEALARIDRLAAALDWAESSEQDVEAARGRLAHAIALYEAIADEDGTTRAFPDLRQVSPDRGRRFTGGPTDQVRAGAGRALARMLGEPAGKPLLEDRLVALEAIVRAADAVDAHAAAGTAESRAHVQQQLDEHIAAYEQLLHDADLPGGFPRPGVSPANRPDTNPPGTGPTSPNPTSPEPLTTPPVTGAAPTVTATAGGVLGRVGDSVEFRVTKTGLATALPAELVADPQALSALEARWVQLVRAGYQVKVAVTKVAGRHATVDPLEFTVEVVDPQATVDARDVYGPADVRRLVRQMITDQQSAPGRHRQPDEQHLTPAAYDPAAGPVSGVVASNESANRARWSFGTAGRADEVVLQLREVLAPELLPNPGGGKPEALPRIPLDWAFARDRARALIPPGVLIPQAEFAELEQRVQQLIANGHAVNLRLRVVDGRLVVDAQVQETTSERQALHENLSLSELLVALDNQVLRSPRGVPAVALGAVIAGLDGIHLQDGSVRLTVDGAQVVVPAEVLTRITAELAAAGLPQEALAAEAVRRLAEHLGVDVQNLGANPQQMPPARPATQPASGQVSVGQAAAEVLRGAALRVGAAEVARRAQELAGGQDLAGSVDEAAEQADRGSGRRTHAPRVKGTRFVADGRPSAEGPLTVGRVLAAISGVLRSDLGGLATGDPTVDGQLVVVPGTDGPQYFRVQVGRVRRGRVAATELRGGTAQDPHVVTFAPGIADSQLTRAWVHELSHTLQEIKAPDGGPIRRLWNRLTGNGRNACLDAQYNEFRYLQRRWAAADTPELRRDIEGLVNAIRKRGAVPPTLPWDSPIPVDPRAELKAAITRQLSALDDTIAALTELISSKHESADEAEAAVAAWHEYVANRYDQARAQLVAARDAYAQLLQQAPDHLAAEAHRLAQDMASYQTALEGLAPPRAALPSMQPSGPLPHLTALTERINAILVAHGIDQRFTTTQLQQLLSAEFGRVLTGEGVVLRVGTERRADLRVKLSVDELVEVGDPKVKASEIINGLFPQGGRRLATAATSKLGWAFAVPMKALLQLVGTATNHPWLGDLTLKGELSGGRTRGVTGNAAEYAQTGAVEDNRGESVLYTGKASWTLDVRKDRSHGWTQAETVDEGNPKDTTELRAWVSHAYTVDPAQDTERRLDLANGRLPAHHLTSIDGLEKLTDDVIEANADRLTKLGNGRTQVEEQLHAVLTNDLPSRLADSTDHAVLRPLTVDGKPVGHVAVSTRIRYESVELVGTQSTTHWQESVRIGFSSTSTQQAFGAATAVSAKAGYDGAALQDVDPDGTDVGPTVSGGRSASRSDALSGGGTSIHVGVHRFVGPTQAYRMVLDHVVTVVLDDKAATTPGDSTVVARVRVRDAYRHGLPVDRAAVHDGGRRVDGDVDPNATVPGRKLELPAWAKDANGRLNTAGPWNIQDVTGGRAAFEAIVKRLAGRGFVPPLDTNGNPDLKQLSTDPIERHAQLRNLEELREQLSTERLEAGYDIATRDGILVTLIHPRTTQATETVVLRISIEPHASKPIGVTTDEAVVLLNIGSDTAGRTSSRSKVWPWRADPLAMSSTSGLDGRASLSYGRQVLGRVLAWMTGGTVNQVTLVESTSPVAVFEVQHTLTVSEGDTTFHTSAPDETARLLIDSDLLPYDAALPATPPSGLVRPSVLQRMNLLALTAAEFTAKLPKAIRNEATALQQLGAFLNPRNLLAHPEWTSTGYHTTLLVPDIAGVSRRIPVTLTGRLQNAQLVAVTEGVSGDINLALGSHGSGVGQSYGGSAQASAGVSENSTGGGFTAALGSNGSTGSANLDIWGVERLTIETGRHYVFTADAEVSLAVGSQQPTDAKAGTVFQLAEREALRFYAQQELALPLHQVADAVERFLHGTLELDRRAATALITRYRADLAAASRAGTPVPALSAEHTAQALAAKLRPSPRPQPRSYEHRLDLILRDQPPTKLELPAHHREHLGFSLIESTELDQDLLTEVYDVLRTEFGVDPAQDPALAQALFVELAGKRWWGRLEDMLGPGGFVRSYPVGRPGELSAEQVTLRIRAEFVDDAHELGEAKDVVGILQRYLYGDRTRSWSSGRSTGLGVDGAVDATRSGSAATDRTEGTSTSAGDQVTRLERIAGFDGMTRVGRRLRLRIEVEHDAAAPTRTPLGRRASPRLSVVTRSRELTGKLVQLIPTVALSNKMPPVLTVPEQVELPSLYHVEGVGPTDGRADLLDVVADALADQDALGADGVRLHRTELEHKLSASARNAGFSRMASAEGLTLAPLEVPGTKQDTVEVTIRARVSAVEVVTQPFEGELGEVNRHMETASTTTSTGRLLPVNTSGTYSADAVSGSGTVGDQVSDAATDLRGARIERSHFEKGQLVTVRVRVDYDLTITRNRHTAGGAIRRRSTTHLPAAATGRAYLTLHHHDYESLAPASYLPPTPPGPSSWRPIHSGAAVLLAIQRAQRQSGKWRSS
ncbi:hypothetical protein [Kribbella sp. HUAS MG21]|uniref:Outer membrane channel protein CpnT-like N-terminal domain-containing protein n=1 Tax=Kribbella sp. HUAS MG21 TaxID=3160966 RepID=A0AAU7TIC0_9ACTN